MNKLKEVLMATLRDKTTTRVQFRQAALSLTHILAERAGEHVATKTVSFETPMVKTEGIQFEPSIVLLPILRSGLALLPGFMQYFPSALIGIIGLKRDEKTAEAHRYYVNLPKIGPRDFVIILDPMLATGGTAVSALELLQEQGVKEEQILFVSIVSAPEGLQNVRASFPNIAIEVACEDEKLSDAKFIIPGLGDFGDRFFGTE